MPTWLFTVGDRSLLIARFGVGTATHKEEGKMEIPRQGVLGCLFVFFSFRFMHSFLHAFVRVIIIYLSLLIFLAERPHGFVITTAMVFANIFENVTHFGFRLVGTSVRGTAGNGRRLEIFHRPIGLLGK